MVFLPKAEALSIPCFTSSMSAETRFVWKERYRSSKKHGVRASLGLVTGAGVTTLLQEAAKDGVIRHGKR